MAETLTEQELAEIEAARMRCVQCGRCEAEDCNVVGRLLYWLLPRLLTDYKALKEAHQSWAQAQGDLLANQVDFQGIAAAAAWDVGLRNRHIAGMLDEIRKLCEKAKAKDGILLSDDVQNVLILTHAASRECIWEVESESKKANTTKAGRKA